MSSASCKPPTWVRCCTADQDGDRIGGTAAYSPFGAATNPTDSWGGFTGHEDDTALGLVNMRGRMYDPQLGRFLSADPLVANPLNSQNWNRYSYVSNSPLNAIDPSGFEEDEGQGQSYGTAAMSTQTTQSGVGGMEEESGFGMSRMGTDPFSSEAGPSINGGAAFAEEDLASPAYAASDDAPVLYEAGERDALNTPQTALIRALAERYGTCTACHVPRAIEWSTGREATAGDISWSMLDAQASWSGFGVAVGSLALGTIGVAGEIALSSNAARGAVNEVPSTLARVVPGEGPFPTLGPPSRADVFVTAADDIVGMNATQIAERLTIPQSQSFTVIEFATPAEGLASPIFRTDTGFVGRGFTAGGAREFVLPNGPVPAGATTRVVP